MYIFRIYTIWIYKRESYSFFAVKKARGVTNLTVRFAQNLRTDERRS